MNWKEEYKNKLTSAAAAVKCVKSGDTVYAGTCTSVAYTLLDALGERAGELSDVTLTCSQIIKPVKCLSFEYPDAFKICTYFMGAQERAFRKKGGRVDFTSMHLSQVDVFFKDIRPTDVAFFEVSPPDENGNMSYGATGVAINKFIKEKAKIIILEVNSSVPYVYGTDNLINVSEADMLIESDIALYENKSLAVTPQIQTISDFLLEQIPDAACIQLGIGAVADAVGYGLKERNDLGAHTELFTDSMVELMENGNINNSRKSFMKGKTVTSFSMGTKRLYDFIDHNPDVYFAPFPVVNNPANIAKNDNMISINTAMSIDLFGQVCADNIAGVQHSATGGQLDFVKGAQMSAGGKSFIALTSAFENKNGRQSRIVCRLPEGCAVTTPRSEIQYVATEYGCINLKNLTMKERAAALISLAHPDFRPALKEEAKEFGLL